MRLLSLGSGSRGNATLLQSGGTTLLIDCGFSLRELESRLAQADLQASSIDALLLTHEHGDHVKGAAALSRRHGIPVWTTAGTSRGCTWHQDSQLHPFHANGNSFRIGEVEVTPFTVPHDAAEPCQYLFQTKRKRLGILTDTGCITAHIISQLQGVDALLLEFNHDSNMLAQGPYPPFLQRRVGGSHGHLSNRQSAELVRQLDHQRWKYLLGAHVSEKNNAEQLVRDAVRGVDDSLDARLRILEQHAPSQWFDL
ncbi:MAG: MBL fold metallo-hydrolase [Pseudomonadota bacterium]